MIRKATSNDCAAIAKLIRDNQQTLLPRSEKEILDMIDCFFIAEEENGEAVGCCCLEVYSPKIAEIRSVAVRSDKREHGYGTELIKAGIEEAQRRNIHEILVVTSSPHFFERLGFSSCMNEKYAMFWTGGKVER